MPDIDIGYDSSKAAAGAAPWLKVQKEIKTGAAATIEAIEKLAESTRKTGKAQKTAAQKLDEANKIQRLAITLVKQHGLSMQTALVVSRKLGGETSKLTAQTLASARAYDRATKEVKELRAAQRTGGGIAAAFGGQLKSLAIQAVGVAAALALARAAVRAVADEARASLEAFITIENAEVSFRKVTDGLTVALQDGVIETLKTLSVSTVPIATEKLIELGAVAGQMGVQTAAGLGAAATAGAQLEVSTDLAGNTAVENLARIISVQGEMIGTIGAVGSGLVALGNDSNAFESDMLEMAKQVSNATANLKLGSTAILGISAALVEVGAKPEAASTAISKLANALNDAAQSGKNLEGLANIAGITTGELQALAKDDLVQAIVVFEQGLSRFGKNGRAALQGVGLGSERVAKSLLPLANNYKRLQSRLDLSNKSVKKGTALQEEAAKAFARTESQIQRAQNALKLLRAQGFEALKRPLADFLSGVVEILVAWRDFTKDLQESPILSGLVAVMFADMTSSAKTFFEIMKAGPRLIAIGLSQLTALMAQAAAGAALLAKVMPGGVGSGQLAKESKALSLISKELEALAVGFGETNAGAGATNDTLTSLQETLTDLQAPLAGVKKETKDVREEFEAQVASAEQLIRVMRFLGETSSVVATAQQLMADGFKGTFLEALTLTRQLENLNAVANLLDQHRRLELLPLDVDFGGPVDPSIADAPDRGEIDTEGFREATNEIGAITDTLGELAGIFDRIGGKFGGLLSKLTSTFSQIFSAISNIGGSGSAGDTLEQFGTVGEILKVFTAIFDIANDLIEAGKLNNFALPIEAGRTGGTRTGFAAVGRRAAVDQNQASQIAQGMQSAFDALELALGSLIIDIDTLGIEIQNSGERIQLLVGGAVFGVFGTIQEAIEAGLAIALSTASFSEELGENLAQVLSRAPSLGIEAITGLVPALAQLDGALQGLTDSQSLLLLGMRQRGVALDQEISLLIRAGVAVEQVLALREREMAAQQRELDLRALALGGVTSNIEALRELQDAELALAIAREEQAARTDQLVESALNTAATLATGPGGLGPGSGPGGGGGGPGIGPREPGGGLIGSGTFGTTLTGRLLDDIETTWFRVGTAFKGMRDGAQETGDALEDLDDSLQGTLVDTVTQIVSAQTQADFFGQLLTFQSEYGLQIQGNLSLSQQQAALNFEADRLRLITAGLEILAARELLNLTAAQVNMIEAGIQAAQAAQFTGARGGGGGRGQRRRQAAEDFAATMERMRNLLNGASSDALSYQDDVEAITEQWRTARRPAEELAEAMSLMADLHLDDVAADWAEAAATFREVDLATAMRHLQERFEAALADALVAAADNPEAYADAVAAIQAGMGEELRRLGRSGLAGLGGVTAGTRASLIETTREIRFLLDNLAELGLTAEQVALAVQEATLPSLLEIIATATEAAGDTATATEARRRIHEIELAFQRIQFEALVAMLAAAGPISDELLRLISRGRQALRELADEEFVPNDLDPVDELRLSLSGLIGDIKSLAAAAGVDLPAEMVLAFAQAQFVLAQAELFAALTSAEAAAIFTEAGLDIAEAIAFITGLEFDPDAGGPGPNLRPPPRPSGGDASGPTGRTTAEILHEILRRGMSELELAADDFARLSEEIAESTGTAAEKALTLAAAEEELARTRAEIIKRQNAEIQAIFDDLTGGQLSGRSADDRLQEQFAELQSLAAAAAGGDEDARAALGAKTREVLDLIDAAKGGRGQIALEQQVRDILALVLGAGPASGDGTGLGAPGALLGLGSGAGLPGPSDAAAGRLAIEFAPLITEQRSLHQALRSTLGGLADRDLNVGAVRHGEMVDAVQGISVAIRPGAGLGFGGQG